MKIIAPDNTALDLCEISENMTCISADMVIENVYLDFSTNVSRVVVRNNGFSNNQITSAYLLNYTDVQCPIITAMPLEFPIGILKSIEFNITDRIYDCYDFGEVKVTSNCVTRTSTRDPECLL